MSKLNAELHSLEYIRDYYKVPARRGVRIIYLGKPGLIVGATGAYIKVKLNDSPGILICHPTWEMEYIE